MCGMRVIFSCRVPNCSGGRIAVMSARDSESLATCQHPLHRETTRRQALHQPRRTLASAAAGSPHRPTLMDLQSNFYFNGQLMPPWTNCLHLIGIRLPTSELNTDELVLAQYEDWLEMRLDHECVESEDPIIF